MDEKDLVIQRLRAELRELREAWECDQQERVLVTDLLEQAKVYPWFPELRALVTDMAKADGLYDIVEEHHGCVVQVLKNSQTGAVSVGWWEEEEKA